MNHGVRNQSEQDIGTTGSMQFDDVKIFQYLGTIKKLGL
jgi:hypothetical protein